MELASWIDIFKFFRPFCICLYVSFVSQTPLQSFKLLCCTFLMIASWFGDIIRREAHITQAVGAPIILLINKLTNVNNDYLSQEHICICSKRPSGLMRDRGQKEIILKCGRKHFHSCFMSDQCTCS
jgi:hypothetical protein